MGNYEIFANGRSLGRGDNFNHPTEAQYYAFDATDAVKAGEPLALGALYHYWTCTCQGRANGPISNTTLAAAQPANATNLKVASVSVFDLGDQISIARRRDDDGDRDRHARRDRHGHHGHARAADRARQRRRPCSTTPARPA